jgi:23S rRNA (cytosine1962-C5)-methyltransferase
VDSSAPAIARAREHAALNGLDHLNFIEGNVLQTVERLATEGHRFGVVICDPPKYAQRASDVPNALKGYLKLNRAALSVLEPDGVLVSCSCSRHVDRTLFADILGQVAEQSRGGRSRSSNSEDNLPTTPSPPLAWKPSI